MKIHHKLLELGKNLRNGLERDITANNLEVALIQKFKNCPTDKRLDKNCRKICSALLRQNRMLQTTAMFVNHVDTRFIRKLCDFILVRPCLTLTYFRSQRTEWGLRGRRLTLKACVSHLTDISPFPGDRVTAVTVSFSQITLEDATAILSQSSPYNVQLHLQKTGSGGGQKKVTTPTGTGDRRHQSSSDLSEVCASNINACYMRDFLIFREQISYFQRCIWQGEIMKPRDEGF